MSNAFEQILVDITRERLVQDEQWGGHNHDDEHKPEDWEVFIMQHASRLTCGQPGPDHAKTPLGAYVVGPTKDYRERLVKIAALAVAAIESFDRKTQRVVIMPKDQS